MSSSEIQTPTGGDGGNNNGNNNNQGNQTTDNSNNSGSGSNNNRNNRNNNRRNLFNGNERTWEGDKIEIGAVLGLRTEYLDKKVSFRVFIEKLIEYVLREVRDASDVLPVLSKRKDPIPIFRSSNMPAELSTEDKKKEVLVAIQQQRVKKFVDREIAVESNMKRIYGLIKGQ